MCGLTGYARHPNGKGAKALQAAFLTMMSAIAHRGRHATGIAIVREGKKPTHEKVSIWKKAAAVEMVIKSKPWAEQMDSVDDSVIAMIGHTRYATLPNAHEDRAAHPFEIGGVVGAHNGMIRNWLSLRGEHETGADWNVDSEAAFALLDKHADDPQAALAKLTGYYALTWWQNGRLGIVRSKGADLTVAYIPEYRAMLWASEAYIVTEALKKMDVQARAWVPTEGTVSYYTPRRFAEKASVEQVAAPKQKERPLLYGGDKGRIESGYSTTRTVTPRGSKRRPAVITPDWNPYTAEMQAPRATPFDSAEVRLARLEANLESLTELLADLDYEVQILRASKDTDQLHIPF